MKKITLLFCFLFATVLHPEVASAQISIYGGPGYGQRLDKEMYGFHIEVGLQKQFPSGWAYGLTLQGNYLESQGIFNYTDDELIGIINKDRLSPFPFSSLYYEYIEDGLVSFTAKPEKFHSSFLGFNVAKYFIDEKASSFFVGATAGAAYVDLAVVDYVIRTTWIGLVLGSQTEEPILLPVYRYERFIDAGLEFSGGYRWKISEPMALQFKAGVLWLPVSGVSTASIKVVAEFGR